MAFPLSREWEGGFSSYCSSVHKVVLLDTFCQLLTCSLIRKVFGSKAVGRALLPGCGHGLMRRGMQNRDERYL